MEGRVKKQTYAKRRLPTAWTEVEKRLMLRDYRDFGSAVASTFWGVSASTFHSVVSKTDGFQPRHPRITEEKVRAMHAEYSAAHRKPRSAASLGMTSTSSASIS